MEFIGHLTKNCEKRKNLEIININTFDDESNQIIKLKEIYEFVLANKFLEKIA